MDQNYQTHQISQVPQHDVYGSAQYFEEQSLHQREQLLSERSNQLYTSALEHSGGNFPFEYLQSTVRRLAAKEMELDERERQIMIYVSQCCPRGGHNSRGAGRGRGYRGRNSFGNRGRGDGAQRTYRDRGKRRDEVDRDRGRDEVDRDRGHDEVDRDR